ncbi:MAG: hypothetical protein ACO1SV_17310 [Fimbriimonas sp.]
MIETRPYVVSRLRLAYIAVEEYVRTFWYFVLAVPLGGVGLLFIDERTIQAVGFLAILWPLSIPTRALLITTKASRLFTSGAYMRAGDEEIEFLGTSPGAKGKPMRMALPRHMIRDVVRRQGMLLVRTYRLTFAPVDPEAFPDEASQTEFIEALTRS